MFCATVASPLRTHSEKNSALFFSKQIRIIAFTLPTFVLKLMWWAFQKAFCIYCVLYKFAPAYFTYLALHSEFFEKPGFCIAARLSPTSFAGSSPSRPLKRGWTFTALHFDCSCHLYVWTEIISTIWSPPFEHVVNIKDHSSSYVCFPKKECMIFSREFNFRLFASTNPGTLLIGLLDCLCPVPTLVPVPEIFLDSFVRMKETQSGEHGSQSG